MLKRTIWLLLAWVALTPVVRSAAQGESRGLIIGVTDHLVYVDLGQRDGIREGELFDIVSTEVLADPLSGDTLAVTPESVGAIRVRQVFEKVSLAELVQLDPGRDPMLMRVAPIQDPARLAEVETITVTGGGLTGPSMVSALVPGLHQYRAGRRVKGLTLMGLEGASLAAAVAFRLSSKDWENQYHDFTGAYGNPYLVRLGEGMQSRRRWSNRFFWLSAGLYAYNLIDVRWSQRRPADFEAPTLDLGMSLDGQGQPLLRLVRTF
ncbi:MAG: FlgT C-terminal domain-containing protein [Candidatus Latescibacterota bacterium]|jgi:hypothetical protein